MYKVEFSKTFIKWLKKLPQEHKLSMLDLINLLELRGYKLTLPFSKKISGSKNGLMELRCNKFANRAYYIFFKDDIYICLNGGKKSTQDKDIKQAEKMAVEKLKELVK